MICKRCGQYKISDDFPVYRHRGCKPYRGITCRKCLSLSSNRNKIGSNAWFTRKYLRQKYRAQRRNISFNLTKEYYCKLITDTKCFFCEENVIMQTIDRLNNNAGYIDDNCVMACFKCNDLKRSILSSDKDRMLKILSKL